MLSINTMESYNQLIETLIRTSESVKKSIDDLLDERFSIRLAQFKLLHVMHRQGGGLEQQIIAKYCSQSEAAVSRQVMILEDKGLIKIKRLPNNKRIHSIMFTEKGVEITERARAAIEELIAVRLRGFSASECEALYKLLQKV